MKVIINYNDLQKNARDILGYAAEIKDINTNLKNILNSIDNNWSSEIGNKENYIVKFSNLLNDINNNYNTMVKYSNTLLGIVDDVNNHDSEYQQMFDDNTNENEQKMYEQ